MDLVVTVPKPLWYVWIDEGDAAGSPESGEEWGFYVGGRPTIGPGDRLYIVAWGRVRGYAPVTRTEPSGRGWMIGRKGCAVAVTIPEAVPGFRGWRRRWWEREAEVPFPDWRDAGVGA